METHKIWNKHVSEMIGSGFAMRDMQQERRNQSIAARGYETKRKFVYDKTAEAALFEKSQNVQAIKTAQKEVFLLDKAEVEQAARLAIQAEAKDESPEDLTKKIIAISGACDAVRNSREDIEKNEAMLKTELEKFINLLEDSDELKDEIQNLLDRLTESDENAADFFERRKESVKFGIIRKINKKVK